MSYPEPKPEPVPADVVTVLRAHLANTPPEVYLVMLCRRSLAARLVADAATAAAGAGAPDQVEDLGPGALPAAVSDAYALLGRGEIRHVGVARGGRWLAWFLPGPAAEVPSW